MRGILSYILFIYTVLRLIHKTIGGILGFWQQETRRQPTPQQLRNKGYP